MSASYKFSLFLLPGRAWSSDSPLDLKSGVLGSNPSSCFRYFRAQLLGYSNEPTNWSPLVPPWPGYGQLTVLFSLFALPQKTSGSAIILSSRGRFYIIRENQINLVNCSKLLPTQEPLTRKPLLVLSFSLLSGEKGFENVKRSRNRCRFHR